ncbi:IS1 transposase [Dickeya chrysanthemi Ech1591]|uniref:IS1 transposase n=1 Tax=Dickeya chrysanthemi (strain Ech1591) TaxID=561229 RepID=C6CJ94_DICC1|nr:IS1 transposase [Dickeya chrysanthemi Ech1591]
MEFCLHRQQGPPTLALLWYAYNTETGACGPILLGHTCRELLTLLTPFNIGMLTSDDWGSYARELPKDKHLTSKILVHRIDRNKLTLKTRLKRLAAKPSAFHAQLDV